jgi:hypothetical protein
MGLVFRSQRTVFQNLHRTPKARSSFFNREKCESGEKPGGQGTSHFSRVKRCGVKRRKYMVEAAVSSGEGQN